MSLQQDNGANGEKADSVIEGSIHRISAMPRGMGYALRLHNDDGSYLLYADRLSLAEVTAIALTVQGDSVRFAYHPDAPYMCRAFSNLDLKAPQNDVRKNSWIIC